MNLKIHFKVTEKYINFKSIKEKKCHQSTKDYIYIYVYRGAVRLYIAQKPIGDDIVTWRGRVGTNRALFGYRCHRLRRRTHQ